ncbi:hypothetical protein E4U45_003516, partial [Claviceps purpurea]
ASQCPSSPSRSLNCLRASSSSQNVQLRLSLESTAKREQDWPKMFDDKPIPFPEGETPEHIGLVRQGDIEKDAPFVKGLEQLESFNKMKQLAAEAPVLAFFKSGTQSR